jgi:phosphoglycerate kinase
LHNKLTLDDINITGKRALIRVDFNVPLDDMGNVREYTRIKAALPTIHNILDYDGSAVLMSHFGRPNGKKNPALSLVPVVSALEKFLGHKVLFVSDCVGEEVEEIAHALKPGEIMLVENVRFHPGEGTNDPVFAGQLAKLGEIFINDAFGAVHRNQASVNAITQYFPGHAAAGRLMMRELRFLERTLINPVHPFIGIVGGAKISSKIKTIAKLLPKVEKLLIGGGMAYTLIKAKGGKIGSSLVEDDQLQIARDILSLPNAEEKILLPVDSIVAQDLEYGSERRTYSSDAIPDGWRGLDLGREAREEFVNATNGAATVLWNGPMGMFERESFAPGTRAVARAMSNVTSKGGTVVVGGGDTTAALNKFNLMAPMTHISTGGGSLLEFMEGNVLSGVKVLSDRKVNNA